MQVKFSSKKNVSTDQVYTQNSNRYLSIIYSVLYRERNQIVSNILIILLTTCYNISIYAGWLLSF